MTTRIGERLGEKFIGFLDRGVTSGKFETRPWRIAFALAKPIARARDSRPAKEILYRLGIRNREEDRETLEVIEAVTSSEGYRALKQVVARLEPDDSHRITDWIAGPASSEERDERAQRTFDWAIEQEHNGTADVDALVDG